MVVFTCNNCGESLQKPKVAKHYQFQCRKNPNLTCVDCHKDFWGEEYINHTSCITEDQRYGGSDYVPKANSNKGEKKQNEWINVVNNLLKNDDNLTVPERNFLNQISNHQNIPRKKTKFMNFVKSCFGNRVNWQTVENAWSKMENAFKDSKSSTNNDTKQENGIKNINSENENNENVMKENNSNQENTNDTVIKNKNNKEKKIVDENASLEATDIEMKNNDISNEQSVKESVDTATIKKISKKRKNETESPEFVSTNVDMTTDSVAKKKKKKESNNLQIKLEEKFENGVKKNETELGNSEADVKCETDTKQITNGKGKTEFSWKMTIIEYLNKKGQIPLVKLKKKAINRYIASHVGKTKEVAAAKFEKTLKKMNNIIVESETVKLINI